jgi:hypothetical protein
MIVIKLVGGGGGSCGPCANKKTAAMPQSGSVVVKNKTATAIAEINNIGQ